MESIIGVGRIVFHCYKYGLLKKIRHVFGYFSSTLQKYIFLTLIVDSWSGFSEDKMDYGSVWLELLIGPCRYMPLSATFEFTTKMCLCSNHRVSPIQRIGWFVWRESFLWSDPIVSYMIWTGSVRSSRISDWHNPNYALSISLTK